VFGSDRVEPRENLVFGDFGLPFWVDVLRRAKDGNSRSLLDYCWTFICK